MEDIVLNEANKALSSSCVIAQKVYPFVAKAYDQNKNNVKKLIGDYITSKYNFLYATAPYDRINFDKDDYANFWKAIKLNEGQVEAIMQDCYFFKPPYDKKPFNPRTARTPFTATLYCCIKRCLKANDMKNAELLSIYLAFSGQFYPSSHAGIFPYLPNKEVLDYVINNKMTGKFDIKKYGNIFSVIRNICIVWLDYYKKTIINDTTDDDDYRLIIQQLHDRIKSFLKNIGNLYYDNRDNYMNYTRNNMDEENYVQKDNNSTLAEKLTSMAVDYLTTRDIDYRHCGMVADENIKKDEVKSIMSSILHNKDNIPELRELINIIITDFMKNYPEEQVSSVKFLTFSMSTKPNTKDKNILREREIITKWLTENSIDYVRRKSRQSTATSYYKCVLKMIVLGINAAVK